MDFNASYESGNTDSMYGRDELYAYVKIWIRRQVKFPLYMRTQHQPAVRNDTFMIECYDYEEVDYYKQLCKDLSRYMVLLEIVYPQDVAEGITNRIDGGPALTVDLSTNRLEEIDGKEFNLDLEIRGRYIAKPFSSL